MADISLNAGFLYSSTEPCTILVQSAGDHQFFVKPGAVYARFDCLEMTNPPVSGCRGIGAFVFEGCAK